MDGARLDREAELRQEIRAVIADLRAYGVCDKAMRGRCLYELWDMRDRQLRRLMSAPRAA